MFFTLPEFTNISITSDIRGEDVATRKITKSELEISVEDLTPKEFKLFQNYPNPFNPTTNIQFSVKDQGPASLVIYTVTGQKVAELINENLEPGYYSIPWDARSYASGMYLYQLIQNGNILTKKMMLIK